MTEIIKKENTEIVTQQQKHASETLFEINPANDKCLELLPNGLLKYIVDPTILTEELASEIVELTREGQTILEISEICNVSVDVIINWKTPGHPDYNKIFGQEYETAYKEATEILEWISVQAAIDRSGDLYPDTNTDGITTLRPNSANVQRSRLGVEAMNRLLENRDPIKYSNAGDTTPGQAQITINMVPYKPEVESVKEAQIVTPEEKE